LFVTNHMNIQNVKCLLRSAKWRQKAFVTLGIFACKNLDIFKYTCMYLILFNAAFGFGAF
jgi:hypothetical protein